MLLQIVILWPLVEMQMTRLCDNSFSELQIGSFFSISFILNSRKKKTQELAWEELQFLNEAAGLQIVTAVP